MHRDLKTDNILLHNKILKVADFGFCKSMDGPTNVPQTMLGLPIYMAPEVIKGEQYTMKANIGSSSMRCPTVTARLTLALLQSLFKSSRSKK
jgi:serine/threonine protein kinase